MSTLAYWLQPIMKEAQDGTGRQELKQRPWRNTVLGLLTCLGMDLPTVSWGLLHQLAIYKVLH